MMCAIADEKKILSRYEEAQVVKIPSKTSGA